MEFQDAKCPNCSGSLQLPDNLKTAKCIYCGTEIIVRAAINAAGVSAENLLRRATSAAAAGNHQEAYDYFTRALEYEPQNFIALLGKAEMAGLLSTASEFRGEELIEGVTEAVASVPESRKDEIKRRAAEIINEVCSAYSRSYMGTGSEGAEPQRLEIINCLELAHNYGPHNPHVMESLLAEYNAMRLSAEVDKGKYNLASIQSTGKPGFDVIATHDRLIFMCVRKTEEYLSKLRAVAPDRAALQMENVRKLEQAIGGVKKKYNDWLTTSCSGCLASSCLTTTGLILLAMAALFSVFT